MARDPENSTDVVVIGRIQGAFGVHGWVRLASYTDPADNILNYEPWLLQRGEQWQAVHVHSAKAQRNGFIAQLEGVEDRDAAAALRGTMIGIEARSLPQAQLDEYYWRDLIGLTVLNLAGEEIGEVVDMMATGANDVMVVALKKDGRKAAQGKKAADGKTDRSDADRELIPFHRQYVPSVDLAAGQLTVDWLIGESL